MDKIAVIGAGSWGTTLADLIGEKNFHVNLWSNREELANDINAFRENRLYLPGIKMPENVLADHSMEKTVGGSKIIIIAVPSQFVRNVSRKIKKHYENQVIVSAAKGIEQNCKRMSQVIEEELGKKAKICVLSGPNHSEEVSIKMPTASIVAGKDADARKAAAECLATDYFKIYELDDVVGVEMCGALKNITAIATGVCDGFGFGDNTKSSIITLGLMEMNNFGRHFGAKRGTVYGLAGVGDLIATCTSKHSRNRFVGEQLAKGKTMDEIKKDMHGMVAEGIPTTKAVCEFSRKHKIDMPLTHQAYEVLFEGKNIKKAIKDLLELI